MRKFWKAFDKIINYRCRKRTNGRKKSNNLATRRHSSGYGLLQDTTVNLSDNANKQQQMVNNTTTSSSSSSASGRSEDAAQAQSSQLEDSCTEESPIYILTSAKGDRSYKLRDSRLVQKKNFTPSFLWIFDFCLVFIFHFSFCRCIPQKLFCT